MCVQVYEINDVQMELDGVYIYRFDIRGHEIEWSWEIFVLHISNTVEN